LASWPTALGDGTALFESYLAGAFAEKTDDVRVQRLVSLSAAWDLRLRRIRRRPLAIELEHANVTLFVTTKQKALLHHAWKDAPATPERANIWNGAPR
jgi:hypothetical protein